MKIRPHERLWHIDLGEIWRYRDLIELFVRRNIVVQYKQTILGPLWYLIQPILTVIMNMVVFGGIAKMSTPQSDCRNSVRFSFCDKASFCRIR
ncbi:hypothetical protein [Xylanibacter ruminicola]|uniref:Lipopolysaccharide transport system permease protein n=1 Tax=Xylanibacter ruminicola TaxID=839 RepID=A0A1M6RXU6_XYLRU|nr:hypothetical protein [Xylanibacter ruminicola]SHK37306.1 lipopolysaccharide transport system permease protein [Xylanibacter ruminicola]